MSIFLRGILLGITLLLLGCHSDKRREKLRPPVVQKIEGFKNEYHLFLNYYFGMTIAEYENATRKNFIEHQIFLAGDKEMCTLKRYVESPTSIRDLKAISRHSLVFHSFEKKEGSFEALLHPVFKFNRLVKIELHTLHCFNFGNHENDFYRRKIAETHQILLEHHLRDFGNYTVSQHAPTANEAAVIKNAGADISYFDLKKYTFNHGAKVVTIQEKCCDFKPVVGYTHESFKAYQELKSTENERELEARLTEERLPSR